LDLEGFMKALNLIGAKSVDGKIDLILKVMDENGNGLLSYDEILERCNLMLD
jgi:Ca2+-binding EF-hand superfamily protein